MSRDWPFPGDSPTVRARRVAAAYRVIAETADPESTAALDRRVTAWGETWAVPTPFVYEPDRWLSPAEAADLACIKVDSLAALRRRGRLTGRRIGGGYQYQAREIYALLAVRGRPRTATDTIGANGTTMPSPGGVT